ncbi:class I SAM-dependent methyltransferase [Streptomyces sp. 1331.2]|uniref:class I SAM-dependent methyltransferase n=1 Tax=Streptomyces sp. 1331.2 TaxID=1938835 RepID=UPI000BDCA128|nr:class I SAM-dependent methyltransferase [Streptomyces sp. 1331.2]SOB79493.1 Methyltransferase domain-containing protein [Streptomyces sp. 1331.2]
MDEPTWDADQAARYDTEHARIDTPLTVAYLAELSGGGDVLEFGVGTGRLAVPLAGKARSVLGVDNSAEMLAAARHRPLPDNLALALGDAQTWTTERRFDLVLCVYNLLLHFTTQDAQLAVVRNAAAHLAPGGHLVVENLHPPLRAMEEGERISTLRLAGAGMAISTQRFDWKSLLLDQSVLYVDEDGHRVRQIAQRMLLPSEQDLMARLAGLRLVRRIANWRGGPWRADSSAPAASNVISVYRRAE